MKIFQRSFVFSVSALALMLFCNSPSDEGETIPDFPHPGMKKISGAGKSFQQGWNDTLASSDEKPGMQTSFTYDYWLDSTEVTQKQFFACVGRNPVTDSSSFGYGDDYPAYFVTWFDAVLFCNARSKADSLDTVYVYFGRKANPNGSVYELTGLQYNLSCSGYRLPTEAEWEFAARGASSTLPFSKPIDSTLAQSYAWFASNAAAKTHPVSTKMPNLLGLYDLAGNVFEWTNDWKGLYNNKNITNSLGASLPGNEYEKVIKGGSFNYGLNYLRPSRRSATYSTTLSSASEYVGFRCAQGKIPGGQYIGIGQQDFIPNQVSITGSSSTLRAFLGTNESKVVFVNVTGRNRTLCYVDFSKTFPVVCEYLDDRNVYNPAISPDGHYVSYSGANEGLSVPAKITIRYLDSLGSPLVKLTPDTAYIPRWWLSRSTGDTCIVYTNSAVANNLPSWKSTKTFLQKVSGGKPVGVPEKILSDRSYHDGLSSDKQYMVTAYTNLMMRNLSTGEEKQLFLSPDNGKEPGGSTQVCNASISPDTGSNVRCLFLDFGCPTVSTVTGSSYSIHQYLFVSSMAGKISNYIRCPATEESWDYPEWSNNSRFSVASVRNAAGNSHGLYAIDLDSKSYLPIIQGVELQQPYFRIGTITSNPDNLALDSLGIYNTPLQSVYQAEFSSKMHLFWKMHNGLEIIFLGSSQVQFGIDCRQLTGMRGLNMGVSCAGVTTCANLIRDYIVVHCPKVRVVAMSTTPYWLCDRAGEGNVWVPCIEQSRGYRYDKKHNFWRGDLPLGFDSLIVKAPYSVISTEDSLGFEIGFGCNGWGGKPPDMGGSVNWTATDTNYISNYKIIAQLSDELSARKIHFLLINFPESPAYKDTDHYFRYGPSWETGKEIMEQFKTLGKNNEYFHFYDAYQNGNHDFADAEAFDYSHLCYTGAAKITSRLDSLIRSFLH